MKTISSHSFKYTLKDIHKQTDSRKFCFVIGAGASKKSGIPMGSELAQEWYSEITERSTASELTKWIEEHKIDTDDLAASYGVIYRKRFEHDKTSGYERLVNTMKSAKPSFGHIVLAQILSKVGGHCVLTTNFDSLIETSIYQFTNKTPLVVGHESLSGYARPSNIHPLIIKVHRDLLLSPKSDPDEINKLDYGWYEPLDNIFSSHIPIIVGYGGNDGSLMSYFERMKKPSNFFWCKIGDSEPSARVSELVKHLGGSFVKIDGFDELMHELLMVFDEIKPIKEELNQITKSRIDSATRQEKEISKSDVDLVTASDSEKRELSALEYENLARNEKDFEKRKAIYQEALRQYPNTDWLWNSYTYFLHFVKEDYENLETYYRDALKVNPQNANNNGNYAIYLNLIKNDFKEAEKYYLKSLTISPDDANFNGNYANFLRNRKKDHKGAEKYYLRALSLDPDDAILNGNYAIFLSQTKEDYKEAEKYYSIALTLDPDDAANNGNFTQLLLIQERKDEATPYLEHAFELNEKQKNELTVELWFYRYAHYPEYMEQAEKKVEELLDEGVRSIGWNLNENVKVAIKNKHPNPDKLKEFAQRITTK